jgi:uncharacterized protein (DUF1330 family)
MIILIYFFYILTSSDRKISKIPRRASSFNNESVKNKGKFISKYMVDFDNQIEKYGLENIIKKEKEELAEFLHMERKIEMESDDMNSASNCCRRLEYIFELQIKDLMISSKISPRHCEKINEALQICFDNFLKIFSDTKSDDRDLKKFKPVLNQKIIQILLEFTFFLQTEFNNSGNYEILINLYEIKKLLSEKDVDKEKLSFVMKVFLQKFDLNNDLLYKYCYTIRKYAQSDADTDTLNLFFSLFVYFSINIPSKKQIFRFENIDLKLVRLCSNNLLFMKDLMYTIIHINEERQSNNNTNMLLCNSLITYFASTNLSYKKFYESWIKMYDLLSEIRSQ